MPWSPSYENARPDSRLDRFRGRAAVATRYGEPAGHLLVHTDFLAEQLGGRLWWRRWAMPVEFAEVYTSLDGSVAIEQLLPADIDDRVAEWTAGRCTTAGTTYGLTWLDEAESDRVHRDVFGHHH